MKLTVKTLKGGKFEVECEPSNTVVEVKGIIESTKTDLTAANMKLIHSGKVLKDDYSIESKSSQILSCRMYNIMLKLSILFAYLCLFGLTNKNCNRNHFFRLRNKAE